LKGFKEVSIFGLVDISTRCLTLFYIDQIISFF
jgi:hypothetical protein